MKFSTFKALSFPILIVVGGLLQSTVAHDRRRVNEIRELDYDLEDIEARFIDPVDQFISELAIRGLLDDFADELVARHKCNQCGAGFQSKGKLAKHRKTHQKRPPPQPKPSNPRQAQPPNAARARSPNAARAQSPNAAKAQSPNPSQAPKERRV
ncbi:hypothetical protein MD484_g3678, partial [Candolleomyces efflorescens]